jgi:hypothetical protein
MYAGLVVTHTLYMFFPRGMHPYGNLSSLCACASTWARGGHDSAYVSTTGGTCTVELCWWSGHTYHPSSN